MRYQLPVSACAAAALSISAPTPAFAQTYAVTGSGTVVPAIPPTIQHRSYRLPAQHPRGAIVRAPTVSPTAKAATQWELRYLAMSAIDAAQTIDCLKRDICEEGNPIFGRHPSPKKLILMKAGLGLVHFAVFNRMNEKNPKAALRFAQASVAIQGSVVLLNARFTLK